MSRDRLKRTLAATPLVLALDAAAAEADFEVDAFDAIRFSGAATVSIRQGSEPRVHARGHEERLARLEVDVHDGRLEIHDRGAGRCYRHGQLHIEIISPALTSLATAGDVHVRAEQLSGESLAIEARGDADYDLPDVAFESLEVTLHGDADVLIAGSAVTSRLRAFGDVRYDASGLQSETVQIDVRGDADVAVRAAGTLDVSIYGDGRIRYAGNPQLTQRVFGDGDITPVED